MAKKRQIEVFSAGCPVCEEAQVMVRRPACPSLIARRPELRAKNDGTD